MNNSQVISGLELGRIARFGLVGVLNTIVGLGTIYSCKFFFHISDVPANVIGYAVGVINSFVWNRNWTFAHRGSLVPALARFVSVFAVAYMANLGTVLLVIGPLGINGYLAQAIATVPYTVTFYLGSRFFVFNRM